MPNQKIAINYFDAGSGNQFNQYKRITGTQKYLYNHRNGVSIYIIFVLTVRQGLFHFLQFLNENMYVRILNMNRMCDFIFIQLYSNNYECLNHYQETCFQYDRENAVD